MDSFYKELEIEEIKSQEEIECAGKMIFCLRMKTPKRITELIEGRGLGDLRYAEFEKFKP